MSDVTGPLDSSYKVSGLSRFDRIVKNRAVDASLATDGIGEKHVDGRSLGKPHSGQSNTDDANSLSPTPEIVCETNEDRTIDFFA